LHHPSPRREKLVSSDRILQRAARGCRSKFVGSGEFLQELQRRRGQSAHSNSTRVDSPRGAQFDDAKPAGHLSASQAAYWLNVFGDAPAAVAAEELKVAIQSPQSPTQPKLAAPASRSAVPSRLAASRGSKRDKGDASDDLEYWQQVFGALPTGLVDASSEQLRLADLENWLKEFQAGDQPEGPYVP
jgi:hypothetical protein